MSIVPTDSCSFLPCSQVERCCLTADGSCHMKQYPPTAAHQDALKKGARALAGTKPARTNRDPRLIKRRRKAL